MLFAESANSDGMAAPLADRRARAGWPGFIMIPRFSAFSISLILIVLTLCNRFRGTPDNYGMLLER